MHSRLIYFYSLEFGFRLFYVFLSFCFCLLINSFNIYNILFFETYPFLKFTSRKFIVTNVMDLFDVICLLFFSKAFFFIFPYVIFQLYKFNSSSWYTYQCIFFKKCIKFAFISSLLILICKSIRTKSSILYILTKWEIKNNHLFTILVEFRIISYIQWVVVFRYSISSFTFLGILLLRHAWVLLKISQIYFLIKHYRKSLIFVILCILFLLTPPDGFLQFLLIMLIFSIFEIVFLLVCYKLHNKEFNKPCRHLTNY
uniref:SecY n=1 Tax=Gracilaria chouae TaxID=1172980 RepID=A0A291ICC8_9FLOR|nr:SecY [Gracilaria chouae]